MVLVLGILFKGAYSEQAIVQVDGKKYTQTEVQNLMKNNFADPLLAIEQLKRDAVVKILAKKRKGDTLAPQASLYRQMFDADYEKDKLKLELRDIPPLAKTTESLRQTIFKQWIEKLADEMVPVLFLDQNAFWSLLQNTNSFKIRKESGYEPKIENWEYTRSELCVDPAMVVATRGNKSYIVGVEMNDYIIGNFNGVRSFAKRGKTVNEVRNILTKFVVAGKLMTESVTGKSLALDTIDLERATDRFVQRNMQDADLSLVGVDFAKSPRAVDVIYNTYKAKNQTKTNDLKRVLKGELILEKNNTPLNLVLMEAAENAAQKRIMNAIADNDLYDWMKANKFTGSQREAREELTMEKYRADIDAKIKELGIVITVF
jgi:hypothetical protein